MGLLDGLLGPALNVATEAASAHTAGQQGASKLLQALQLQQAQRDHLQTQAANDRANTLRTLHQNQAPVLGEDGYAKAEGEVAGAKVTAETPGLINRAQLQAPIDVQKAIGIKTAEAPIEQATHLANRKADVANPLPHERAEPQPQLVSGGVGPDGKPIYGEYDKTTHSIRPIKSDLTPRPAGGANGQLINDRLEVSAGQASDAHDLMTAYEQKVLHGEMRFDASDAYLAKKVMHGSDAVATAADASLNDKNPEFAAYIRGAKMIAAAERMIAPRGGSNALMGADMLLAGAGAHANPALIHQAWGYRNRAVTVLRRHLPKDSAPSHNGEPGTPPASGGDDVDAKIDALLKQGKSPAEIKAILGGP